MIKPSETHLHELPQKLNRKKKHNVNTKCHIPRFNILSSRL